MYCYICGFVVVILIIGVWAVGLAGGGGGGGCSPPRSFQIAISGKKSGNIRAKPLDFRASNGQKYVGKRLQPPK